MRILMVHNRYQVRGGEDEVCDSERRLLQAHGHEVDLYEAHNDQLAKLNPLQTALHAVWSDQSYRAVQQTLQSKKYDIVHVHNFLPLISPSVYHAAKSQSVPVVQTLHNYRLLCANALFYRDGQVCEDCLGKALPLAGVRHGCYRKSRAATGMVTAMNSIHHAMKTWTQTVDAYIALTEFVRQKYIEGGIPADKIHVKPNFVSPDPGVGLGKGDDKGDYAIYVGRLSVEKGLDTLLEAWETIGERLPLKIIGDGPLAGMVDKAAEKNPAVEPLGRRPMSELYERVGNAKVLIFPSKWYETFGLVAIEAFAKGTPVVAANIGAIAELIDIQKTGLLFEPGNPQSLVAVLDWVLKNPVEMGNMRQKARQQYEEKYTASRNYAALFDIYRQLVAAAV